MIKELNLHTVHNGNFGDSGQIGKRFRLKKNAIKYVKSHKGFRLNKDFLGANLYENEVDGKWFRIDREIIVISD